MESSAKSLSAKLGVVPGQRAHTLHAPAGYRLLLSDPKPPARISDLGDGLGWLQAFYTDTATLSVEIDRLKSSLGPAGQLWISWPKRSSAAVSDLSDETVREIGLEAGLVDVKVAAIDKTWSGLKFVRRLADR